MSEGVQLLQRFFFVFVLVDERRDDQNTRTKSGPSSARQRNAIQMAFRWRPDDGLALNSGLIALQFSGDPTSIAKKTYFYDLSGGGGDLLSPPLDPPMQVKKFSVMSGRFVGLISTK